MSTQTVWPQFGEAGSVISHALRLKSAIKMRLPALKELIYLFFFLKKKKNVFQLFFLPFIRRFDFLSFFYIYIRSRTLLYADIIHEPFSTKTQNKQTRKQQQVHSNRVNRQEKGQYEYARKGRGKKKTRPQLAVLSRLLTRATSKLVSFFFFYIGERIVYCSVYFFFLF